MTPRLHKMFEKSKITYFYFSKKYPNIGANKYSSFVSVNIPFLYSKVKEVTKYFHMGLPRVDGQARLFSCYHSCLAAAERRSN